MSGQLLSGDEVIKLKDNFKDKINEFLASENIEYDILMGLLFDAIMHIHLNASNHSDNILLEYFGDGIKKYLKMFNEGLT